LYFAIHKISYLCPSISAGVIFFQCAVKLTVVSLFLKLIATPVTNTRKNNIENKSTFFCPNFNIIFLKIFVNTFL